MNTRQILAQGALAVLNPEQFGLKIDFRMDDYCDGDKYNPNQCGTSCCYAGHIMVLHPDLVTSSYWYENFSNFLVDFEGEDFLAYGSWNDDRQQCAERVRIYLEEGTPENWIDIMNNGKYPVRPDTVEILTKIMKEG